MVGGLGQREPGGTPLTEREFVVSMMAGLGRHRAGRRRRAQRAPPHDPPRRPVRRRRRRAHRGRHRAHRLGGAAPAPDRRRGRRRRGARRRCRSGCSPTSTPTCTRRSRWPTPPTARSTTPSQEADAVDAHERSSYLDRITAGIAAGLALARRQRHRGGHRRLRPGAGGGRRHRRPRVAGPRPPGRRHRGVGPGGGRRRGRAGRGGGPPRGDRPHRHRAGGRPTRSPWASPRSAQLGCFDHPDVRLRLVPACRRSPWPRRWTPSRR